MESLLAFYGGWASLIGGLVLAAAMVTIYRRAGLPPAWAVLGLVPVFGLAFVLMPLALLRWPTKRFDRNGPLASAEPD